MAQKAKKIIPYSNQDYDSILESIKNSISELTPEWTNISDTDTGMTILEENAKMFDVLSWKADIVMNEALPGNSTLRNVAIIQAKWLGYKAKQSIASTTVIEFTVVNDGYNFVIPKGTVVADSIYDGAVVFETDESVVCVAPEGVELNGTYTVSVGATQGLTVSESLGYSDGTKNQIFQLNNKPYINKSLEIICKNNSTGTEINYTEANLFVDMSNGERKFLLDFDDNGYGFVMFGDGLNGVIPDINNEIIANYRIGGGSIGNKSVGDINILISTLNGGRVDSLQNIVNATGGEDLESISSIYDNAPYLLKTKNRLVTDEDCLIWARAQAGVGDAAYKASDTVLDLYTLYLCPSERNLLEVPTLIKTEIETEVNKICMMGDVIEIADPVWVDVKMNIDIYVDNFHSNNEVQSNVEISLYNYLRTKKFGEELSLTDLYECVKSVDGVLKLKINELCKESETGIADDITCAFNEIVKISSLDSIVINVV